MAGASIRRSDAIEQGVKPMVVRESGNPYDAISQADRDQAKHMDTEARARGFKSAADLKAKRSEEHTSELQSLMRTSYAVFCLKKKITIHTIHIEYSI